MLSYNKLWKLLIDKGIKKQDLRYSANISSSSLSKLAHGQNVNTSLLNKICKALNCNICDIVDYMPDIDDTIIK